jgi:hypothetical protein
MSTTLREGELEFDFSTAVSACRFDDPPLHGLTHCMKSVDFIVELTDFVAFVEVKDPDNSKAPAENREAFAEKLQSGQLVKALTSKFRDTRLYRWAIGPIPKPVKYVVLLQLSTLQPPALSTVATNLKRGLPTGLQVPSWNEAIADDAVVLDIAAWNRIGTFGTVRRT